MFVIYRTEGMTNVLVFRHVVLFLFSLSGMRRCLATLFYYFENCFGVMSSRSENRNAGSARYFTGCLTTVRNFSGAALLGSLR